MAASGFESGLAGVCDEKSIDKDDAQAQELDKTIDGDSLGFLDDQVTEKGKSNNKENGDLVLFGELPL